MRGGRASLKDAYGKIVNGEVFVYQMHISPYPFAYYDNHDPLWPRKLLLHKREIKRLYGKVSAMLARSRTPQTIGEDGEELT